LKEAGRRPAFITLSANDKLLSSFGRSLLDQALRVSPNEVQGWFDEADSLFRVEVDSRIKSNMCCIYAGLCLAARVCASAGLPWDEVFPFDHEACAKHIEYSATEYLLDGGAHNKGIVEQTFEVMSRMKLKQGEDYAFENNGQFLCLWLCGVYDKFTKYKKDYAIGGETLTLAAFRKQFERCEFFVEKNRKKRFGDVTKNVWVLDFSMLSRDCDVSGFVRNEAEEAAATA
jgi:hypothetical protein